MPLPTDKKRKLTIISHDASRTGAPILLLRLIKELVRLDRFDIQILVLDSGLLLGEFERLAPTRYVSFHTVNRLTLKERVLRRLGLKRLTPAFKYERQVQTRIAESDLIFANTILSIRYLQTLQLDKKRIFFYIHELHFATKLLLSKQQMQLINEICERVYVPAEFVKNFLVTDYAFSPDKVRILKYVIPYEPAERPGILKKNFIVGACGSLIFRKGFDLFVLIVREIVLKRGITDIMFYWIGGDAHSEESIWLHQDLEKCGIRKYVNIVFSTNEVIKYLNELDLFVLTSREDPYPLVVLEAAALGIPAVYFNNSGGIGEFVRDGGVQIDYLDIASFCDAIIQLKQRPELLKRYSMKAKENVEKEKADFNILDLVNQWN